MDKAPKMAALAGLGRAKVKFGPTFWAAVRTSIATPIAAFSPFLAFSAPPRPYPVVTAEDLTAEAWLKVGEHLSLAMAQIDEEAADSRVEGAAPAA